MQVTHRIEVDVELDELGRYFHTSCQDCGEYRDWGSQMEAEDYVAEHECEEAVDGDSDS